MSLFKFIVCVLIAHSVIASPSMARHHDIAARMASLDRSPLKQNLSTVRRRSLNGRCRQSPSTVSATAVVGHIGSDPTTFPTTQDSPVHSSASVSHTFSSTAATSQSSTSSSSSGDLPSYMTGVQYGDGTYYNTGLTACGVENNDNQLIAAVSQHLFDTYPGYNGANPNTNPVCGRKVKVTYKGNSVIVTITDRCVSCLVTDLDMSPAAMAAIDPNYIFDGRIHLSWVWVS